MKKKLKEKMKKNLKKMKKKAKKAAKKLKKKAKKLKKKAAKKIVVPHISKAAIKAKVKAKLAKAKPPHVHTNPLYWKIKNTETDYDLKKKYELMKRRLMVDHLSRYYDNRLQREHMRRQINRLRRLESLRFGRHTYRRFHFRNFRHPSTVRSHQSAPHPHVRAHHVKALHRYQRHVKSLHSYSHAPAHHVFSRIRADHGWCVKQCSDARKRLSVRSAKNCKICQGVFKKTPMDELMAAKLIARQENAQHKNGASVHEIVNEN